MRVYREAVHLVVLCLIGALMWVAIWFACMAFIHIFL
jgi:hypothetical protein